MNAPTGAAGGAARAAVIARDRTLELEFNFSRLGVCGKAYHEAAEIEMERNRTKIRAAKVENRQLRAALDALLFADKASFRVSDMQRHVERVKLLRRVSDDQKNLVLIKQRELAKQINDAKAAQLDLRGIVQDRSALYKMEAHIALIQNRIRASKALRKSYTATVTPMRRERAAFDVMMANYEKVLKTKEKHLKNLRFFYHDAERARTQSKYELDEILLAGRYSEIRFHHDKQTADSKSEMAEMNVEIAKIRDVFNQPTMKEMFMQLLEQEKRTQYYEQMYRQIMDAECNTALTATQRAMLRQNIPGIHVMNEVLHIESRRRGPLFGPTLMAAVKGTGRVIGLLDRMSAPRVPRHSGNLINMLAGTKRLADKIMMEDWGEAPDTRAETLAKCKKRLLQLLQEVGDKIKSAKKEKELKRAIGEDVEDQMYEWITLVEQRHTERQRELGALRLTDASVSEQSNPIPEPGQSLLDFLMTPVSDVAAAAAAATGEQRWVGRPETPKPPVKAKKKKKAKAAPAPEPPKGPDPEAIRKQIEEEVEKWIRTIEQQVAEDPTRSGQFLAGEDFRQEIEGLVESWLVLVEAHYREQQDRERIKAAAQDIVDQMESWIESREPTSSSQGAASGEEAQPDPAHDPVSLQQAIQEQMDGWLATVESRHTEQLEALQMEGAAQMHGDEGLG